MLFFAFSVYLKPGNVIQFISRASARSIQIVVSKETNELICDAIGGTGPFFPNAYWLVVCGPHGRYFFHNNYNYLSIKNGKVTIIPSSTSEKPPVEAEFRVQDVLGSAQAIYLESVNTPGYFLNFDEEGVSGDENKAKIKDKYTQFEIQLVSSFLFFLSNIIFNCLFLRLLMDLVFNQKKMIILLKHQVKHHHHHIGQQHQQLEDQHHQHQIDNLKSNKIQLHRHHKYKQNKFHSNSSSFFCRVHQIDLSIFFLSFLTYFLCCILGANKERILFVFFSYYI